MSYTAINAQLFTIIDAIANLGPNVYAYPRWSDDLSEFDTLFLATNVYHAWWIERVRTEGEHLGREQSVNEVYHIHGIYGRDDDNASYQTFQGYVDEVLDAINSTADVQLNQTDTMIQIPATLLQFENIDEKFGPILVHHAIIEVAPNVLRYLA